MGKQVKGKVFEDYVARNLSHLLPSLKLVSRHKQITKGKITDMYAKDAKGREYYIEVKASDCNRVNIGQVVEYKAELTKVNPEAKMILICRNADTPIKETLRRMGIRVHTFADLRIPAENVEISEDEHNRLSSLRLSPTEQKAYFALLRKGVALAGAADLASVINVSEAWAKNILSKLAKHGAAYRIGRGKYVVIPADVLYGRKSYVVDPLVLVSELMKGEEYCVAYQSAAHVHGMVEQVPFRTTVAVVEQKRPVKVGNAEVVFVTLKRSRFFGFKKVNYSNAFLNVSDLERTVIDCMDRSELCGGVTEVAGTLSDAVANEDFDWGKLVSYVRRFKSYAVAQRLGFLLEHLGKVGKVKVGIDVLDELLKLTGRYVYPLDVRASKTGKVSRKWKIIENVRVRMG